MNVAPHNRFYRWIAEFPSTNGRIMITLGIVVVTSLRYHVSGLHVDIGVARFGFGLWEPSWEWLLALTAWLGIDTLQFSAKRLTHRSAPPAAPDIEDVQAGARVGD